MVKPFGEDWDYGEYPLAYLITIRTYGTWLHGDERKSVDTHGGRNRYATPKVDPNAVLKADREKRMGQDSVILTPTMRRVVEEAIKEVCLHRRYRLRALNVRSNHGHVVVSAQLPPEPIADAFKAYATRKLRMAGLIPHGLRPWARGRSRRYLWKEAQVELAVEYVRYSQGDTEFDMGE